MSDVRFSRPKRLAKARFWAAVKNNPSLVAAAMTDNEIACYSKSRSTAEWLKEDDFRDWFLEQDYDRAQLVSAADEAIKALLDVVNSPIDPKQGITGAAKVAAASKILEAAGLAKPEQRADKEDEDMSRLTDEEIKKKLIKLMGVDIAAH
jgi:hypothetical protein